MVIKKQKQFSNQPIDNYLSYKITEVRFFTQRKQKNKKNQLQVS